MHFYFRLATYGHSDAVPEREHIQGEVAMGGEAEFQESSLSFLPVSAVKMISPKDRSFMLDIEDY